MENKIEKKLIALVEDDQILSDAIYGGLKDAGFEVERAFDGEEGLAMALAKKPDLILLDILMPKMDGMTMFKKLRQENAWGKSVPVIVLTNLSGDNEKINKEVTEYEPAYYLVKSNFKVEDIIKRVQEYLKGVIS